jgi:hypothetical protein
MIFRLLSALSLAFALVSPAAASVLTEAGGQFSKHWHSPTVVGPDVETILGVAEKQNGHEFLALTGLATGDQTLRFVFSAPASALTSDSYSAGGQVFWSAGPFGYAWDGTGAGTFQLSRWTPEQALELVLGPDFAGVLHLGIYFTHGRDVAWTVSLPSAPASVAEDPLGTSVVPLSAAAGYWLAGMSLLAALGLRGEGKRRGQRRAVRAEEQGSPTALALSRPLPA